MLRPALEVEIASRQAEIEAGDILECFKSVTCHLNGQALMSSYHITLQQILVE